MVGGRWGRHSAGGSSKKKVAADPLLCLGERGWRLWTSQGLEIKADDAGRKFCVVLGRCVQSSIEGSLHSSILGAGW